VNRKITVHIVECVIETEQKWDNEKLVIESGSHAKNFLCDGERIHG
jgi:hypothetical protein